MIELNYSAIIVAALASMVIGALWYSPLLFGKAWMKLSGLTKAKLRKMKKKAGPSYVVGLLASLVMAYVLANFLNFMRVSTLEGAAQVGLWLWLGFVATTMLGMVLWEGRPVKLYVLNAAYQLVSIVVMAVILGAW